MDQEISDGTEVHRSFFQTPAFWIGGLLWLAALAYGVVVWQQKTRERSAAPTVASETPAVSPGKSASSTDAPASPPTAAQTDPPPKQITITTDKDGSPRVVLPGQKPDLPYDKDGIADFSFVDTEGRTITKGDLMGRPWIVCFVFTHCAATCPAVTNSMRELQDQLKDYDFRLVTLTVDPVRDTPEVLKEYGRGRGADFSKWMFLHGDQRDIYRLIHGSFKMPVQELLGEKRQSGFEFIHSNNIMLVDETGVVRGKFDATSGPEVASLRREIQKLARRKSAEAAEPEKLPE
jgi:protein SCO1/2/putative membrane protein